MQRGEKERKTKNRERKGGGRETTNVSGGNIFSFSNQPWIRSDLVSLEHGPSLNTIYNFICDIYGLILSMMEASQRLGTYLCFCVQLYNVWVDS